MATRKPLVQINGQLQELPAADSIDMPLASSSVAGGVKIGDHMQIASGVINPLLTTPKTNATFDPANKGSAVTLSSGNLVATNSGADGHVRSTIGVSSGKHYIEFSNITHSSSVIGIAKSTSNLESSIGWASDTHGIYAGNGNKYTSGSGTAYMSAITSSDVIGVLLDMDAGTLTFYKNNVSQGVAISGLTGTWYIAVGNANSNVTANFGASAFTYSVPSGHKSGLYSGGVSLITSAEIVAALGYTPASGSGLTLLSTVTASASATVDIETTFDGTYDNYLIVANGIVPATDGAQLYSRMKLGGSYDTGNNYYYTYEYTASTSSSGTYGSDGQSGGIDHFTIFNYIGSTAGYNANFTMQIFNAASTTLRKLVTFDGNTQVANMQIRKGHGVAGNTATSALTGVRFYMNSGNITSGTFRLYGIKKS